MGILNVRRETCQAAQLTSSLNGKLDDLIDRAQQTFDVKKREKLLCEHQQIILEDAPGVTLWNSMDIYAHRSDLEWKAPPDEKVYLGNAYLQGKT
jgi:ABC-type transport system substrate-binding protein